MITAPRRTAAVIPAWNEASTVGAVVYAALVDEVVVVDNASTDGTAATAEAHGARVVHEPTPGKGQALRAGVAAGRAGRPVRQPGVVLGWAQGRSRGSS